MIKVVDLLYKNPSKAIKTPNQMESMEHLLLNEVLGGATVNTALQKEVFDLICVPEPDPENVIWRRDILEDFLKNPSMFDDLRSILAVYQDICKNLLIATRGGGNTVYSKKEFSHRDSMIFRMRSLADAIVKCLELYETSAHIFSRMRLTSEAFISINEFIKSEIRSPDFISLKELAEDLSSSLTLDTSYVMIMKLNKYFCIEDVDMLELDPTPYRYETPKKRKNFDSQAEVEFIGFDENDDHELQGLVEKSIAKLTQLMEHIVNEMKSPFEKINKGIFFYRFGLHLENTLKDLGLPVCLPNIDPTTKGRFECKNACDLWLAMNMKKKDRYSKPGEKIVKNDISMKPEDGAYVITGKNNAGKTVFLRTIGMIQILAQAGLPVPAESCYISTVNGLYAYFTAMDTGTGRFEDEVKSVSSMLDIIHEGDMVLFNEAFQSTAFDEAADVLCNVFVYGAVKKFRCISVTHLPDIKERMDALEKELRMKFHTKYATAVLDENGESTYKIAEST